MTDTMNTVTGSPCIDSEQRDISRLKSLEHRTSELEETMHHFQITMNHNLDFMKTQMDFTAKSLPNTTVDATGDTVETKIPICGLVSNTVLMIFAISGGVMLLSDLSLKNLFILMGAMFAYNSWPKIVNWVWDMNLEYYLVVLEHTFTNFYQKVFDKKKNTPVNIKTS